MFLSFSSFKFYKACVLVTFHVAVTKYLILKGRNVHCSSQFVDVSAHSSLAPRQRGTAEGHHRGETVHSKAGRRLWSSSCSLPLFYPFQGAHPVTDATYTQGRTSHYIPKLSVDQFSDHAPLIPASHTLQSAITQSPTYECMKL